MKSAEAARHRANGQCEAMINASHSPHLWSRCIEAGTDVHHMLPRSRGGTILDKHGEIGHLIVLCRAHHKYAHEMRRDADLGALMIDGQVMSGADGKPRYRGTNEYLLERYGVAEEAAGD